MLGAKDPGRQLAVKRRVDKQGQHTVHSDLVCFGRECVTWAAAFGRGRHAGWAASLPSMATGTNATCRHQGQLRCDTVARGRTIRGTVCARQGQQKCSDLLELRPDFTGIGGSHCDPEKGRNRGSVLSVRGLAWPPPTPPWSALLQAALDFVTNPSEDRMNWVSKTLAQSVAPASDSGDDSQPVRALPVAGARTSSGGGCPWPPPAPHRRALLVVARRGWSDF